MSADAPDCIVSLDNFVFQNFEIPQSLPWGGSQAMAVHKLPGGNRVIDAMGRDDRDITWSGVFLGANANQRAQFIDYLRAQGAEHTLTWFNFNYTVIIKDFEPDWRRYYRIPFTLTLRVVSDNSAAVTTFTQQSLDDSAAQDMLAMGILIAQAADQQLSALYGNLQNAIAAVVSIVNAPTSALNAILFANLAVQGRVGELLAGCTTTLENLDTAAGPAQANPVLAKQASLNAQVTTAQQMPVLMNVQTVSAHMGANIGLLGTAADSNSVQAANTTLYKVAQQQYGDASQWATIAKANNLNDPNITGPETLLLPPAPAATGGVLQP